MLKMKTVHFWISGTFPEATEVMNASHKLRDGKLNIFFCSILMTCDFTRSDVICKKKTKSYFGPWDKQYGNVKVRN